LTSCKLVSFSRRTLLRRVIKQVFWGVRSVVGTEFLMKFLPVICGNQMPTRRNRGFYFRSYCLLNKFRAPLCPSSGAQEYYTVVAACGISCCKNVKSNFVRFCGICVLSLKCRVLSNFVTRCVECRGGCVWVLCAMQDETEL